ncbi:MAG: 4-hydroxybenzoyl-CoA reductase subunit alpha [Myxococcota bacterium]|nr:4-hydroxybenzoyl-CoA reductase subunit alpha [Myxococcota bacterium]
MSKKLNEMPVSNPNKGRTFKVVGRQPRKPEGLKKVSGEALYTDDIVLPRMLHAKILRSIHAHARIRKIDASKALALPGVHAVVTGNDMPIAYGIIPWTQDEYPLCTDKTRFVGDGVAAVAAVDEDTANRALELIEVEYEVLPAVLSPEQAREHPEIKVNEKAKDGNLSKHVFLEFGDMEGGFARADVVDEDHFYFENTTHAPIEPHCAIGQYDRNGVLTVWSSTQVPHYLHRELARVLNLPQNRVRVIQPLVGGAFGGKSEPFDLEFCVAKLAMITGRPVKILYTREEVFYSHRGRHPMEMTYRTGATKDGKLTAIDAKITFDGGAYSSFGLVTAYYSGQLLTAPYQMPAYRFDSSRWFTNKPACGPKRGHGSVQPRFAFEVQLDKIAHRLNLDPIELRRRNFIGEYTETINGLRITSNGFLECLDAVEKASGWKERRGKLPFGKGLGVAGSMYISGTNYPIYPNEMPQSAVLVRLDRSGRAVIFCGASEIGQGVNAMLANILCEELGTALADVQVVSSDTDLTPIDLGAYSSRVTFMCGNACIDAARKLRKQILEACAEKLQTSPEDLDILPGEVVCLKDTAKRLSTPEAFQLAEAKSGSLAATGSFKTNPLGGDYRGGTIGASPAYSFTAHVAEVTVDPGAGFVTVDRIWIAHDCGKAINPILVEGQMEGSAYMGCAEAIMEAQTYNSKGMHIGPSLLDYRIPTSLDTPEMQSLIIESIDPEGPYGAKEAGEGPLHPSIPAVANAIFDAVGVRLTRLPFTPAVVLKALREKEERERRAAPAAAGGQ